MDASSQNIIDLDLKNTENAHIGYEAKRLLKEAKSTDKDKLLFKGAFRKLIIVLIQKLLEKSPIEYRFGRGLTCFDPKFIKHQPEGPNKRVDVLLEIMHKSNKIKGHVADNAKGQYQKMVFVARNAWSQYFKKISNDDKIGVDVFN